MMAKELITEDVRDFGHRLFRRSAKKVRLDAACEQFHDAKLDLYRAERRFNTAKDALDDAEHDTGSYSYIVAWERYELADEELIEAKQDYLYAYAAYRSAISDLTGRNL